MTGVWVPASADELSAALSDGTLPHESASYEYKEQLPLSAKNVDIALDVSAMTVDGGLVIYGVGEDKARVTFYEAPIQLAGVLERISNTVVANVQERPDFDVRLLPTASDPTKGFVVVQVPASPRAPHMVEVKNEYRFYGRVPGGNVKLTETTIAQLYDRRLSLERSVGSAVDEAIAEAPISWVAGQRADMHLVAKPFLADGGLRQRVFDDDDGSGLRQAVLASTNALRFKQSWTPAYSEMVSDSYSFRTLDGASILSHPMNQNGVGLDQYCARLEMLNDGTTRYFRSAIAIRRAPTNQSHEEVFTLREPAVAQNVAHFTLMTGQLLKKGDFYGQVDLFIALTGAAGAPSTSWFTNSMFPSRQPMPCLPTNDFRDHVRAPAAELLAKPDDVAERLLGRLSRLLRPPGVRPLER